MNDIIESVNWNKDKDYRVKKGELLVFTDGMYSDYYLHSLYRAKDDFDLADFSVKHRGRLAEAISLEKLLDQDLLEVVPAREIWIG